MKNKIIELFTKKLSLSSQKYGLGSEIRARKKPTLDPGSRVRKAPDPGYRLRNTILHVRISTVYPCANRILKCRQTEASSFSPQTKKDEFLFTNYQITAKVKNVTRNRMCSCAKKWPHWMARPVPELCCCLPCLQRLQAGTYLLFRSCNSAANWNWNRKEWTNERGVRSDTLHIFIFRR